MRADYQLRHGMFGKTGTVWSRQVDPTTRSRARAITEIAGSASILRRLDVTAAVAAGIRRVVVDDISFRFLDGDFAVIGRNQNSYTHVTVEGEPLALVGDEETSATPFAANLSALDARFLDNIAGAEDHLSADEDWYLIPMPHEISPVVIEGVGGLTLVAGVDFSTHRGYIATRHAPAEVFPSGLVRIVTAMLDLPAPHSYVLSAPVDRRSSKYLMQYAKQAQSLRAFRLAAAEYCGMHVFEEPDVILSAVDVPGATVYITASLGALRIDYPHTALQPGAVVGAGFAVSPRFEIWATNATSAATLLSKATDIEAVVSLDGVLPIKGLYAPTDARVLIDYVDVDPVSGKPHARMHLAGATEVLEQFWELQRQHELATGYFLFDQFMEVGQTTKLIPFGTLMEDYYGPQLSMVVYSGMATEMRDALLRFVSEHKPVGCVILTAEVPA